MEQFPAAYRRPAGTFIVTALGDGYLDLPADMLTGIAPDEVAALLHAQFHAPSPRISVNAFLLQGGGKTILIDTGAGRGKRPTMGRLSRSLGAAGVSPEQIDLILLTHLHSDHVGGLLAEGGTAFFPRAELAIARAELDYWRDPQAESQAPEARRPGFATARDAIEPYRARTRVIGAGEIAPGIAAVPLPGHTPGHTGYLIDDTLLVWGDIAHVPDVQTPHPEVCTRFDVNPAQAEATRRHVLDMAASERLAVTGMHLHFPGFSHVLREGDGYRLVPEAWHHDLALG